MDPDKEQKMEQNLKKFGYQPIKEREARDEVSPAEAMKPGASDPLLSQASYTPAFHEAMFDPGSRWGQIYSNMVQDPDVLAEFQAFLQSCPKDETFRPKDHEFIKHVLNIHGQVGMYSGAEKVKELKGQCENGPFGYYIWFVYKCCLKAWQSSWPETDFRQLSYVILQVLVRMKIVGL
jgi:hypothetical protein